MLQKLILTSDGSHSIELPELGVTYHSIHGAIQESTHVFINAGLKIAAQVFPADPVKIFEMGFGTGLNALLSLIDGERCNRTIVYDAIEGFPLQNDRIMSLNYCKELGRDDLQPAFEYFHSCEWEKEIPVTPRFILRKSNVNLLTAQLSGGYSLIYFDAFDPGVQPELWTEEIFAKMFSMLQPGGLLVTYSSKGTVRRAMQAVGFKIEKLAGPPGKREMIRGTRPTQYRN